MLEQGSPADLAKEGIDFVELVETTELPDPDENVGHFNRSFSQISQISRTRSLSIDSMEISTMEYADEVDIDEGVAIEASSKGTVNGSLYLNYFRAGASWFTFFILGCSFMLVQFLTSASDYWISVWYDLLSSLLTDQRTRSISD